MKRSYIIGIVIIAAAIGAIFTSLGDAGTYASFSVSEKNEGQEYHVVGKLDRSAQMVYEPEKNPNLFIFYMKDADSVSRKVFLHQAKPQDFEHAEQIVVIGKTIGAEFHASSVLMKCPSKYTDSPATPSSALSEEKVSLLPQ